MAADLDCSTMGSPELVNMCQVLLDQQNLITQDVNIFFILWSSAMVFSMHAGFATLSAGAVRAKSTTNILLCIVMDSCMCAIAFWLTGYGLAYGETKGSFIGTTYFFGEGIGVDYAYHEFLFQWAFAATAATIVSGAIAERANFAAYLSYSFFLSLWVYPVVVKWVWGGGFLTLNGDDSVAGVGAIDFAGCGPVHMVGGVAGVIGSKLIGPRIGRFDSDGTPREMPGHSSPLATLGTFILWVGWFSFNPGSALTLVGGGVLAERAAVNTLLASATGGLGSLFLSTYSNKMRSWDATAALNGVLSGLVSITAGCATVDPWVALAIGLVGGMLYVFFAWATLHVLKVDDPLDATAVHFGCGMWGLVASGLFARTEFVQELAGFDESVDFRDYSGVAYGGNGKLLGCQLLEIVVILLWVFVFIFPYFYVLKRASWLRISVEAEHMGIDSSAHGGHAYPEQQYLHTGDFHKAGEDAAAYHEHEHEKAKQVKPQSDSADLDGPAAATDAANAAAKSNDDVINQA